MMNILSVVLLVNDTLLVNESSPTEENGALYQSSAGNTKLFPAQNLFFRAPAHSNTEHHHMASWYLSPTTCFARAVPCKPESLHKNTVPPGS